jgi:hypothetical protein
MSGKYTIDKSQRLVVTIWEGVVGLADIEDHQNRLLDDPAFDPSFDHLIDTRAITDIDLSSGEVRIAAYRKIFSGRRAIVASQAHIYGVGRMMQVYHEKLAELHVFYSMEEALDWLGRDLLDVGDLRLHL